MQLRENHFLMTTQKHGKSSDGEKFTPLMENGFLKNAHFFAGNAGRKKKRASKPLIKGLRPYKSAFLKLTKRKKRKIQPVFENSPPKD